MLFRSVIERGDIVILNAKRTKYYDMSLKEIHINNNHPWKDKELKDLNLPKNNLIVMIKREGGSVIPRGNTLIKDKDIVLIKEV
nr:TrkA C-terminal domain-containing protein [uncultured Brachyspira sp.]